MNANRFYRRFSSSGLAMLALALLPSCLGDPCDDAWEPDYKRGFVCADTAERCAQLDLQLDRKLGFVARMVTTDGKGKPLSSSSLKHRATCVADFIRTRGVDTVQVAADNASITTTTTFRRLVPAMQFKVVADFTANCGTSGGCDSCAAIPAGQCTANAFCVAFQSCPP